MAGGGGGDSEHVLSESVEVFSPVVIFDMRVVLNAFPSAKLWADLFSVSFCCCIGICIPVLSCGDCIKFAA